jgi:SAM-dependent methyltransferase
MRWHGSDKGNWDWHNYTTIYSAVFGPLLKHKIKIFELGLGSNRAEFGANMGRHGRPGASLRGWRDLFPSALLFGADIDRAALFTETRITTFQCDQLDSSAVQALWAEPSLRDGLDIIVDDGLHTLEGSIRFLDASLRQLRPGGIYVIEDVGNKLKQQWLELLDGNYSRRYPDHEFVLAELPLATNDFDNNLLLIRRKPGPSGAS